MESESENKGKSQSKASPSDRELIARFVAKDLDAFRLLVERYEKKVSLYLSRYFKLTDRVADITQETFLRLFRRITDHPDAWPKGESILPLLMFMAARAAARDFRKQYSLRELDNTAFAVFPHDEEPFWAETAASVAMLSIDVQRAHEALPPSLREVMQLYFLDGHSGADVAEMTGSTLESVKIKIFRARQFLKEFFQQHSKGASHDVRIPPGTGAGPASSDPAPGLHR
jgi:RNA polymerase sigma-70 factor, ECF subfamily